MIRNRLRRSLVWTAPLDATFPTAHLQQHTARAAPIQQWRRHQLSTWSIPRSSSSSHNEWKQYSFSLGPKYSCPWDMNHDSAWLQPLTNHKPLDYQSRYVIQLLQEYYKSGGRSHSTESITTDRCNDLLKQLLTAASSSVDDGARHRADAILQTMQLFAEADHQHSFTRVHRKLPSPDMETYRVVLQLFAKTPSGTRVVPERALQIVDSALAQPPPSDSGEDDLSIRPFLYNCVLNAWRLCRDDSVATPEQAARVFRTVMTAETRDMHSFVTILQHCAQYQQQQQRNRKDDITGCTVAIQIWEDVIANDPDLVLKSHVYTHFLQAIRGLPLKHPQRAKFFRACLQRAVVQGKVNEYLINEFVVHGKSPRLFREFLGKYADRTLGMTAAAASQEFQRCIPDDWKAQAD